MRTTSIAATMVSGNSESMVRDAVMSVVNYVDRVVLIDTGINDSTERIVREVAGIKLHVLKRPWDNDFAGMRNTALPQAEAIGCQWALTINTDERMLWGDVTPEKLRLTIAADPLARAYMVMTQDNSYAKERLIRVPTSLFWQGRTHETIIGAGVNERPELYGVSFWELAKNPEQIKIKLERDLVILREEIVGKPNVSRWWYYLGQTLSSLGQHAGAIEVFDRSASVRDWAELFAWACYSSAKSLSELKRFREAVDRCGIGLAIDPKSPELAWMAGWCEYQQGQWNDAIAWSLMSLAIGHAEGAAVANDRIGFRNLLGWYEGPLDVLRYSLRKVGRDAEANEYETRCQSAKLQSKRKCHLHPKVSS